MATETVAPPAPAAPQVVKSGGVTFTRETITPASQPQGAQGVKPSPSNAIPPPLKPISQTADRGVGPARKAMLEELHKRAKAPMTHETEERKAAEAKTKTANKPAAAPEMGEEAEAEASGETGTTETVEKAEATTEKKEKVNPWKLVEEHKTARSRLEAEVAELKKTNTNAEQVKQQMAEIEKIKARNSELEGAIALVDARKDQKFINEYQKPYEKAWTKAMQDLRSLTVDDPKSGEQRAIQPNDLLRVINVSDDLEASEIASELFGDEEGKLVMRKREIIRDLFDKQQEYLDDVAKNGGKMMEERARQQQEQDSKMYGELEKVWHAASDELISTDTMKPYFAPIDGDDVATQKLEKGYEFVDDAMKKNPRDPKLTADERAKVIRAHAAVRHRAAAFTRMMHMDKKKSAIISDLSKRLAQYEEVEPEITSGQKPIAPNTGRRSAWDEVRAELYKRAK